MPSEPSDQAQPPAAILRAACQQWGLMQTQFLITPDQRAGLFLIADAYGSWGNVFDAGPLALQTMMQFLLPSVMRSQTGHSHDHERRLRKAVQETNRVLFDTGNQPGKAAIDDCLVVFLIAVWTVENEVSIAHVGKNRAYLLPEKGGLRQLTQDHLWLTRLIAEGKLSPEAAMTHAQRHVSDRSVGMQKEIEVDLIHTSLEIGDRLLLCTTRLAHIVPADLLEQLARRDTDPAHACDLIMQEALKRDGRAKDYLNVIVIHRSAST